MHVAPYVARFGILLLLAGCPSDDRGEPTGPEPESIDLNPDAVTLEVDEVGLVAASVRNARGATVSVPVEWSSRRPDVVEASTGEATSVLVAVGVGTAWVLARAGEQADSVHVTVAEAAPLPAGVPIGSVACPAEGRRVPVETAGELRAALEQAAPGDVIVLAPGRYPGHFVSQASGTAERPITLCGPRGAVIDGGGLDFGGFALTISGSHWALLGFTILNTEQGLALDGSRHSVVRGLLIADVGQEALHLFGNASQNLIEGNTIRDTGRSVAEWGEGIYLGSFRDHWCQRSGCRPDRTDSNTVRANRIGPDVRAELIDAKEGTRGNVIEGNRLDGRGQVASQPWIESWMEINGDGYRVTGNRGRTALHHGFEVTTVRHDGVLYGRENVFERNEAIVDAAGYGFAIDARAEGTVVRCDNLVSGAGAGTATVGCEP